MRRKSQVELKSTGPENAFEKIIQSDAFNGFTKDFMAQARLNSLDTSTWFFLSRQILEWAKKTPRPEINGVNLKELEENLFDPGQFKKYIRRLDPKAAQALFFQFLAHRLSLLHLFGQSTITSSYVYKTMARALGVPIYHVGFTPDHKLAATIYAPLIFINREKLSTHVNAYLNALSLDDANEDDIGCIVTQTERDRVEKYQIDPSKYPAKYNIDDDLTNLIELRKQLQAMTAEELDQFKVDTGKFNFWFPQRTADVYGTGSQVLPVLDFAIHQAHYIRSYQMGRFMAGHYPKKIEDARNFFMDKDPGMVLLMDQFKQNCSLIKDVALREALLKMFDSVYVIASKELLAAKGRKTKHYTTAQSALSTLNNMATLASTNETGYQEIIIRNNLLGLLQQNLKKIEPSYPFIISLNKKTKKQIREAFDENREAIKSALTEERPVYEIIDDDKKNLFQEMVQKKPKDPKKGAKPGGIFDMVGGSGDNKEQKEKRFMIKRGDGLGDTLSEYLAHLEFQQGMLVGEDARAAVTHLVVEEKKDKAGYHNLEDFAKHILVASEYADSYYSPEAHRLAGFDERPRLAATRYPEMFEKLIWLNEKCHLGGEFPLFGAMNTVDTDFHTGNNILVHSIEHIDDAITRELAIRLIQELEQYIDNFINDKNKTPQKREQYWQGLADKINALKEQTGAKVFFQKIDHGFAYYRNDIPINLLSHRDRIFVGKNTNIAQGSKLNPLNRIKTQPTNHIGEWTSNPHAAKLVLSDQGCDIILQNTEAKQIANLKQALDKFFHDIKKAAAKYGSHGIAQKNAELYLLQAFYKHLTGQLYSGNDIKKLQRQIIHTMETNRKMHINTQNKYYGNLLQRISQKTPKQEAVHQYLIDIAMKEVEVKRETVDMGRHLNEAEEAKLLGPLRKGSE